MYALKWHPDSINRQGPVFANKDRFHSFMSDVFQIFKEAYQTLMNDTTRKRYNLTLLKPVNIISSKNAYNMEQFVKSRKANRAQSIRKF